MEGEISKGGGRAACGVKEQISEAGAEREHRTVLLLIRGDVLWRMRVVENSYPTLFVTSRLASKKQKRKGGGMREHPT